jgi:GT2 family glycosyltransferase
MHSEEVQDMPETAAEARETTDAPAASVVVPSFNRPEQLANCLEALTKQEGIDYEVIVVDDGSPEPLGPICARFGPRVRCLRQDNAGPAAARNRGAAEARGAFVAFTDDDCRPRPDWLSSLMRAHGGREDALVGGHVENGLPNDPFATASQDLCDYLYDYFGATEGDVPFFTSNNIGLTREGFRRLGGFDETFPLAAGEDRDLGLRWQEDGGRMVYAPDAVIDHYHGMTLQKFWKQHENYGRGAYHLHKVLDARQSKEEKRQPLPFYINLVLYPLKARGIRGLGHSMLMGLMQVATISGYRRARRADGDRSAASDTRRERPAPAAPRSSER